MRVHVNMLPTYFPDRNGTPQDFYRQILNQVETAERLGFEGFWFTEHHFVQYGGAVPNPAVMIAAAATRTERIRLGSCISILPLQHPMRIAEDYAMVDMLSDGRLEFGIGAGNSQVDFDVYEINRAEARARFDESISAIRQAWSQASFSHDGDFWHLKEVELYPRPLQRPHPPIWAAGTSEPSLGWAGQQGFDIMTVAHPHLPESQRAGVETWEHELEAMGHARADRRCQLHARVFVHTDREVAEEVAKSAISRYDRAWSAGRGRRPGQVLACDPEYDWDEMRATGRNIYGTPDDVLEGIRRARANYMFDTFSATFNFGGLLHSEILPSMELFAAEVLPAIDAMPAHA